MKLLTAVGSALHRFLHLLRTYPNLLVLALLVISGIVGSTLSTRATIKTGAVVFVVGEVVYCATAILVLVLAGGGWGNQPWRTRLRSLLTFHPLDMPHSTRVTCTVAIGANRLAALLFPGFLLIAGNRVPLVVKAASAGDMALTLAVWAALVGPRRHKVWHHSSVSVRPATLADIPQVLSVDSEVWGTICPASAEMFRSRLITFPEGGLLVAEIDGRIVAFASVQYIRDPKTITSATTWQEISDHGTLRQTHELGGVWIYGVGLACTSEGSKHHAAKLLMRAIGELAVRSRKKGILLVARTTSFRRFGKSMSPQQYVLATRTNGKPLDAELYLYAKASLRVRQPVIIIQDYMEPGCDPSAGGLGVVVEWKNPFYPLPLSRYWALPLVSRFVD